MNKFKKAERKQVKLKLALTGPSGAGKTYSALRLAKGLVESGIGKKIALIDTENESASLYAGDFEFDTLVIEPPYTIPKFKEAFLSAEREGYDVVVCDSISHAWAGEGGLLAKKESLDSSGRGNSYTNWGSITKEHEAFKATILNSNFHLICTMRSKQDYVLEKNDKGKEAPRKVGLAPIQRDGMEYEFTTVFDISMSHECAVSKDRTNLFDGQIFQLTEKTGHQLAAWLSSAKPAVAAVSPAPAPILQPPLVSPLQRPAAPAMAVVAPLPLVPEHERDPGAYIIRSGHNTGKKLSDLSQEQLLESIMKIEQWARENKKNLESPEYATVNEFITRAKDYLTWMADQDLREVEEQAFIDSIS